MNTSYGHPHLNFDSMEIRYGFEACAAFIINLTMVFCEYVDIVPTSVDDSGTVFREWQ